MKAGEMARAGGGVVTGPASLGGGPVGEDPEAARQLRVVPPDLRPAAAAPVSEGVGWGGVCARCVQRLPVRASRRRAAAATRAILRPVPCPPHNLPLFNKKCNDMVSTGLEKS